MLYFKDIIKGESKLLTDFSFLPSNPDMPFESDVFSLKFKVKYTYMSFLDYRFESVIHDKIFLNDIDYDIESIESFYNVDISGDGHKLGGYPKSVQYDPRANYQDDEKEKPYELLFQMDSQWNNGVIMWGDMGVEQNALRDVAYVLLFLRRFAPHPTGIFIL